MVDSWMILSHAYNGIRGGRTHSPMACLPCSFGAVHSFELLAQISRSFLLGDRIHDKNNKFNSMQYFNAGCCCFFLNVLYRMVVRVGYITLLLRNK